MLGDPRVYGREELADRVSRHEGAVLLLTGDSGVGKSTVLLLSTSAREGWVSPRPTTLARSAGSLHDGFLEQLGVALSDLVQRGLDASTLSGRLTETGRRLLNERSGVLGRVALAEIVAVVRGRVGDDVGKAVQEYARDIWPDDAETLAAKASRARDPLAYQVLVAFAATAQQLAPETSLALSLDQAERLTPDDHRVLADLAESLPGGVHVRLAYATDTPQRTKSVAALRGECQAIDEIEVSPLTQGAIENWLSAEDLAWETADQLTTQTGGYPLLVEAAVAHLSRGGQLGDMPRHQQLAQRTRASFDQLSSRAAATARSLAVLADPLADDEMRQLAGITGVGEWATVTAELEDARIFSVEVNGRPWFHAERRAFILNECLSEQQRDEAASAAASLMWSEGFSATDFSRVALFSALVGLAPGYQAQDPGLTTAVNLDTQGLAVASALLELAVEDRMAAFADDVFSHALSFVEDIEDPESVLSRLVESNFVAAASNESATAIAASWSPKTQAVVQGRSSLNLRRTAVPRLVEGMFNLVLRDKLGEFQHGQFGIGSPSIGSLGRVAAGAEPRVGYVDRDPEHLGNNLLLRGTVLDEVLFYCAARFPNAAARDAALRGTQELSTVAAIGEVRVTQAVEHPLVAVPTQRFASAFRRARRDFSLNFRETGDIELPPPERMSDEELAAERVRAAETLVELASPLEVIAMELDDGYVLAWNAADREWDEAIVHGAGFSARHAPTMAQLGFGDDSYDGLRLRRELQLTASQTIVHRRGHYGEKSRSDPLGTEVAYRRSRSRIFNSAQPRLRVALSKNHLQPLLANAFAEEMRDARALAERFPRSTDVTVAPTALWILIALDAPSPGWVAGARGSALYAEGPSPTGQDFVELEVVQGQLHTSGFLYTVEHEVFERTFPDIPVGGWGSSTLDWIIARTLRYEPGDIDIVWPDEA